MKKLSKLPYEIKTVQMFREPSGYPKLSFTDNDLLDVTPIGFLLEPVTNPFTCVRLGLIAWNDMQMGMEDRLTGYSTAVPTQIVALWIVFSINQCFDFGKE